MGGSKCKDRVGEKRMNNKGCLMKIIEYNNRDNIIVEFQDNYKSKVNTKYDSFVKGIVKNPYCPTLFNIGIIGNKYPSSINGKTIKEYQTWYDMLRRCFDDEIKENRPSYKNVTCCDEWLLYENFYEWLHKQENFEKWLNDNGWAIDKDIIIKGNKTYSPKTCCLVPRNINSLFTKYDKCRGDTLIGVTKKGNKFEAQCKNPLTLKKVYLGRFAIQEDAFKVYKAYKENLIKQIAQKEYSQGNITKQCYEAMLQYEVEITD